MNLKKLFQDSLLDIMDQQEIECLTLEYLIIEKLWSSFFNTIDTINLVILAEAPLNSNQYIFNENSRNTIFLYKSSLEKCFKEFKANPNIKNLNKIELMRELGIIVIEAYPFALDPKKHKNNFSNLDPLIKNKLFNKSYPWHLKNKLELIKTKINKNTIFSYRYERNRDFLSMINEDIDFIYIGDAGNGKKSYGAINESKLISMYKKIRILNKNL